MLTTIATVDDEITALFEELAARQEPLGAEFQAVFDAHISELYEE